MQRVRERKRNREGGGEGEGGKQGPVTGKNNRRRSPEGKHAAPAFSALCRPQIPDLGFTWTTHHRIELRIPLRQRHQCPLDPHPQRSPRASDAIRPRAASFAGTAHMAAPAACLQAYNRGRTLHLGRVRPDFRQQRHTNVVALRQDASAHAAACLRYAAGLGRRKDAGRLPGRWRRVAVLLRSSSTEVLLVIHLEACHLAEDLTRPINRADKVPARGEDLEGIQLLVVTAPDGLAHKVHEAVHNH